MYLYFYIKVAYVVLCQELWKVGPKYLQQSATPANMVGISWDAFWRERHWPCARVQLQVTTNVDSPS